MSVRTFDAESLRSSLLFKDVKSAVLEHAATFCRMMELRAGDTLFEQESPSDALYILESGQVHVIRRYPEGDEVILATESPYYVIGELSMLAAQPRTGTVVAVSDCELIMLSRDALLDVCDRTPDIAVKALTHLGQRLYGLNLRVRESAIGNIAARVASVLLIASMNDDGQIDAPVTRLARATATDADRVERMLRDWAKDGVITFDSGQVTVRDTDALRALAG